MEDKPLDSGDVGYRSLVRILNEWVQDPNVRDEYESWKEEQE